MYHFTYLSNWPNPQTIFCRVGNLFVIERVILMFSIRRSNYTESVDQFGDMEFVLLSSTAEQFVHVC